MLIPQKSIDKISFISIAFIVLFLNSCNVNQSVKKDFNTQAYSRGNGLSCSDISIQVNEKDDNRNEYIYGEKVNFTFNDIKGFNKINGKVFPGLSLVIIDNKKDTVMSFLDLLEEYNDGTKLSPLLLRAHFIGVLPYENREKYTVHIKIWDKKGKGTFSYEMPFTVKKNKLLKIGAKGLKYSTIYLWNNTTKLVVTDKYIDLKNEYNLIIEGISGLENIENMVYPVLPIEIRDRNGKEILSNSNILEEYRMSGVDTTELLEGQIPVTITFTPGTVNNPCRLKASVFDQNSNKRIDIEAEIELQ